MWTLAFMFSHCESISIGFRASCERNILDCGFPMSILSVFALGITVPTLDCPLITPVRNSSALSFEGSTAPTDLLWSIPSANFTLSCPVLVNCFLMQSRSQTRVLNRPFMWTPFVSFFPISRSLIFPDWPAWSSLTIAPLFQARTLPIRVTG